MIRPSDANAIAQRAGPVGHLPDSEHWEMPEPEPHYRIGLYPAGESSKPAAGPG